MILFFYFFTEVVACIRINSISYAYLFLWTKAIEVQQNSKVTLFVLKYFANLFFGLTQKNKRWYRMNRKYASKLIDLAWSNLTLFKLQGFLNTIFLCRCDMYVNCKYSLKGNNMIIESLLTLLIFLWLIVLKFCTIEISLIRV